MNEIVYNNDKVSIINLIWDENYFGVKSGKIILKDEMKSSDFEKFLNILNDKEYITIVNKNNNYKNNGIIGENIKAYLTDVNVQFEKTPSMNDTYNNDLAIDNNLLYNDDILNIASKNFKYSRFFNDSNLDEKKAKMFYFEWVKNSFNKECKYFITYKDSKTPLGFILFSVDKCIVTIELICVDKKDQNKNVGTKLVEALENYSYINNIDSIRVGTQIDNIPAMNFYQRYGFKIFEINSVYHFWRK